MQLSHFRVQDFPLAPFYNPLPFVCTQSLVIKSAKKGMEDNRFVSRLHHPSLLATARKSIMNVHHHHHHHLVVVPSSAEEVLGRPGSAAGSSNKMGGIVPVVPEEQKAKARDQQKKWRENLKKDTAKSSEYREMQRERTRYVERQL